MRLAGIVVAVHGITDSRRGVLRQLAEDVEMDVVSYVKEHVPDTPMVLVENDANLAALAEWERHRSHGVRYLISLSGELSLGAGIVLDGQLHQGSHGFGGTFSHMTMDPAGPACFCGRNGCWNTLVGLRHVLRNALPDVAAGLERIPGYAPVAVNALVAAAQAKNEQVLDALAAAGAWLGEGAANIANAFDPDIIVVGGFYATVAEWLIPAARDALRRGCLRPMEPDEVLVVSDLDSAPYRTGAADLERARVLGGGLHCVIERLIEQPLAIGAPKNANS